MKTFLRAILILLLLAPAMGHAAEQINSFKLTDDVFVHQETQPAANP